MVSTRLTIRGFRIGDSCTTIKLEPEFWELLEEICRREKRMLGSMISEIDRMRGNSPRASAIRVFVLKYFCRAALSEQEQPSPTPALGDGVGSTISHDVLEVQNWLSS